MAFTTPAIQAPVSDSELRYTTTEATVGTTPGTNTGAIALQGYNKVDVQIALDKSGGTSTDTVTVKLQGSHDSTNWFDLPDVAGTGQEGTVTSANTADLDEVLRLNYDFSTGSGQAKPRFIRLNALTSASNGAKAVALDILLTKSR